MQSTLVEEKLTPAITDAETNPDNEGLRSKEGKP